MSLPVQYISSLCRKFRNGELSAREFSNLVEEFWNFGDWEEPYSKEDRVAVEKLFDVVVWYSEFEHDVYPKYRSAADVRKAADEFLLY